MAKLLRIGSILNVDQPFAGVVDQLRRLADAGFDHAFATQIFGPDALTLLAAAGAEVPGIGLGTGVVPIHPRHPMMLAAQALTVQAVTDNRLILGIGLSHQVMVEGNELREAGALHEGVPGFADAPLAGRSGEQHR
jgi:alkanesulfonate monooxygenase SsuD/methylene tetrahydromethanopterin reductase-like flavin-dependent oxidoreductase (luciferase family)